MIDFLWLGMLVELQFTSSFSKYGCGFSENLSDDTNPPLKLGSCASESGLVNKIVLLAAFVSNLAWLWTLKRFFPLLTPDRIHAFETMFVKMYTT